jgi:hypothetical protein
LANTEEKEPVKKFPMRMYTELHDAIKDLAEDDKRSMHSQILILLEEALKARGIVVHPKTNAATVKEAAFTNSGANGLTALAPA